jgi:ubiquinone/menaquinone biosynthesis C-methylase UbiE
MSKHISVFEKYAHEYDLMTNAAARKKPHAVEVQALIDRFHPTSVLDAGCATGLTTYLFAKAGIPAVGLDRSKPMLEIARQQYSQANLPMAFLHGNFEKLPAKLHNRFDMVVCLANSISGVGSIANLVKALSSFKRCLKPGGKLVVQMLNFAAIQEGQVFPIRATRNGDILYQRFSERVGSIQHIHVIRTDLSQQPPSYEIFRHSYGNFTRLQMVSALRRNGFEKIVSFGKLDLTEKFKASSRDLILISQRQSR